MCRPTTCEVCGKTTWKGCGKHIDSVKKQVPADQWCDKDHSDEEYAAWHMPNSLNIPHTQLRDRLDEVRAWFDDNVGDQPFVVMCAAGVRSWIGYRIVRHAGFNVTMLSGGIQTLRAWLGDRAEAVLVTGEG